MRNVECGIQYFREPLTIPNGSLPPRIQYWVNSGGSPVMSKTYGFLLESIPMKIGAGMTFLSEADLKSAIPIPKSEVGGTR